MRFILETITGRKGIKNFSSLEEYVDFMTKNGDKIKNIVESDLPYDDKPVSVATPSQSNGWEQVNKATFGDVIKKAEKGDCVLPHKASSVFKDEAKFEPSKSSEKADTSSEPKVDSTPVKNNNEGSEKDLPKFEYKDEEKSSSETSEKSEPKEEKKDSEDKDDKKEIKESFEDDYEDEDEDDVYKEKCMNIINMLPTQDENKAAKILDKWVQKGDITQDEYDYIMSNWDYFFEPLEEGFGDKIHDLGVKAKQKLGIGLSGKELEDYINEYFVYVFMIANHQVKPNHPGFEKIAEKLIKTDSKMENVHDVVMSILEDKYYMNGFPADTIEDLLKRRLAGLGIDESIIDKAYNTFVKEEKNKNDGSFDDEIAEALRIAGVQLNEAEDDILELDEYDDDDGINLQVLQELYDVICENYGEEWLSDSDEIDFMDLENAVSDFGNDIDGYDESLRHDYALALKDKWLENNSQKNINESEYDDVDSSLIDKIANDPHIYNQGRDEIDDGQDSDDEKISDSIDYIINNYGLSGRQALKAYSEATFMDYDTVKNAWESDGSSWDENDMPKTEDVNNPNDGDVDEKTGKEKLMEEDPSANFNQDEVDDLMSQYERAESDYHAADFYDDNYSWNKGRSSASSRMSDIENKLKQLTGKSYKELLDTLGSKQVDEDRGPSFKVGDKFNKNGRTYEIEKIEKSESKSRDHQYTNYWYHVREINGSRVDVFTDSLMKELGFKPISK